MTMLMLTNLVFIANIISNETTCCLYNSQAHWTNSVRIYEYVSNANPIMSEVPIKIFTSDLHEQGSSAIIQFDLSRELQTDYPATSPNLLANFIRILENETLESSVIFAATSQTFYVIRGNGSSLTRNGSVSWSEVICL
jgi:hypothetical protein